MKKMGLKKSLLIVGGIVICLSVVLILSLLINTDIGDKEEISINFVGTWKVLQHAGESVEDEYIIFDTEKMTDYNKGEVHLASTYTVDKNGKLTLTELPLSFSTRVISDNYMRLVEEGTNYEWELIRTVDGVISKQSVDPSSIVGRWQVLLHGGQVVSNEEMEFRSDSLTDYQNGEVYMECSYQWLDSYTLFVEDLNLTLGVYPISAERMMMVEQGTGYVWEFVMQQ